MLSSWTENRVPTEGARDIGRPFPSEPSQASIDAASQLSVSLMGIVRVLEGVRHLYADAVGVTPTAIRALGRVAEFGPITPKELAVRMALTTGTITPLLDHLVSAALVERVPNPADRRSIQVQLTATGRATMSWVYDDLHARVRRAVATDPGLDPIQLARWLDAITGSLSELSPISPAKKP